MTYAAVFYWATDHWMRVFEGADLDPSIIYAAPLSAYPVFVWWWTGQAWQSEVVWTPAP